MQDTFLIATTHHLFVLDENNQVYRLHTGKGLYFGLTTDGKHIFVACRNEVDYSRCLQSRGDILILDAISLKIVDTLNANFALRDMHGIAYIDNKLWVTCSYDNLIAIYDFAEKKWTKWYPAPDPQARDCDVNHFNTVELVNDKIGIIAHNFGYSDFLFYDKNTLDLISIKKFANQAHNIFMINNVLATCSSANGLLMSMDDWVLRTGGYPRGVGQGKKSILIGISVVLNRGLRGNASGVLRQLNKKWHYMRDYVLPNVGEITAILPISPNKKALSSFEKWADVKHYIMEYNEYHPGNIYTPNSFSSSPDWHQSEETHRWTASREASMEIIVNPGERKIRIDCYNGFSGHYRVNILVNGREMAVIKWTQEGCAQVDFLLPVDIKGRATLTFKVPALWKPRNGDQRRLGLGIREVRLEN